MFSLSLFLVIAESNEKNHGGAQCKAILEVEFRPWMGNICMEHNYPQDWFWLINDGKLKFREILQAYTTSRKEKDWENESQ